MIVNPLLFSWLTGRIVGKEKGQLKLARISVTALFALVPIYWSFVFGYWLFWRLMPLLAIVVGVSKNYVAFSAHSGHTATLDLAVVMMSAVLTMAIDIVCTALACSFSGAIGYMLVSLAATCWMKYIRT